MEEVVLNSSNVINSAEQTVNSQGTKVVLIQIPNTTIDGSIGCVQQPDNQNEANTVQMLEGDVDLSNQKEGHIMLTNQNGDVMCEGTCSSSEGEGFVTNSILCDDLCGDIGAQICIPDEGQIDVIVPQEVVVETSLQSGTSRKRKASMPRKRKQKDSLSWQLTDSDLVEGSESLEGQSDDQYIWSQFDFGKYGNVDAADLREIERESFVALAPGLTPTGTIVTVSPESAESLTLTAKELARREKDRIKQRERRANLEFRLKEKEKAKVRMANKRNDPVYREIERQKDRERRKLAREQNETLRDRERLRDRVYKKNKRCKLKADVNSVSISSGCETNFITTYVSAPSLNSVLCSGPVEKSSLLAREVTPMVSARLCLIYKASEESGKVTPCPAGKGTPISLSCKSYVTCEPFDQEESMTEGSVMNSKDQETARSSDSNNVDLADALLYLQNPTLGPENGDTEDLCGKMNIKPETVTLFVEKDVALTETQSICTERLCSSNDGNGSNDIETDQVNIVKDCSELSS